MAKVLDKEINELNISIKCSNNALDEIKLLLFSDNASIQDLALIDIDALIDSLKAILARKDFVADNYHTFHVKFDFENFIQVQKTDIKASILEEFTKLLKRAEHYRNIINLKILASRILEILE